MIDQGANPLYKQHNSRRLFNLAKGGNNMDSYQEQPFDSFKYTRSNITHNRKFDQE